MLLGLDGLWNNGPGVEVRVTPQSSAASRTMLWLSVLRADTPMQLTFMLNGNSWAQPEQRGDGGWLQTIAVPQFQEEVKMLLPSLLPVFGSSSAIAEESAAAVSVETATLLQPHSGPSSPPPATAGFPVVARGWTEECGPATNSSGLCAHIVVANQFRYGAVTFSLRLQLPGWPLGSNNYTAGSTAHRLFLNGGYDVPLSCRPGTDCKEGTLTDTVGAAETVVYEVGCNGPPPWKPKPAGDAHQLVPRNGTDQIGPPAYKSCSNRRVACDNSMWGC